MALHLDKVDLREHMLDFVQKLQEEGLDEGQIQNRIGAYYTNNIIRKYSAEDEDAMWDRLMEIAFAPGGMRFLLNSVDYMPVFEHRRFKGLKSQFGHK